MAYQAANTITCRNMGYAKYAYDRNIGRFYAREARENFGTIILFLLIIQPLVEQGTFSHTIRGLQKGAIF